ncbi:MAG: MMPL family transporter, partial [Ktedonobacterales bacterium]
MLLRSESRAEAPETVAAPGPASPETPHTRYQFGLRYGRFIHRVRWLVLALWLVALLASVPFASKIGTALRGGGFTLSGSESVQVENLLHSNLNTPASQAIIVLQSDTTPVSDAAYQQEIATVVAQARTASHVTAARQGPVSQDGRATLVLVNYGVDEGTAGQYIASLRQALPHAAGPARVTVSGSPATYADVSAITQRDLEKAETYSLPLALLALLIVFGTLAAGAMPLALALFAVPVALGVIDVVAAHTWTSIFVLNVATVIGLGISIDYSLIMTRRFREEIANGRPIREAIAWTVATTGEAILFSGLTVMIGFTALLLIGIPVMSSFGIGGAVVVGTALLAALTLLPALLSVLGSRVNALRLPLVGRLTAPQAATERGHGFWHRWALGVMRRPVVAIVAVVALLMVAGTPIFALNPAAYGASPLAHSTESQHGFDVLSAEFPQIAQAPIEITARTPDGSSILSAANIARVQALSTWLAAQPHVTSVTGLTSLPTTATPGAQAPSADQLAALYASGAYAQQPALAQLVAGTTHADFTVITVTTSAQLDSHDGKQLISTLRAGDTAAGQGLRVLVGGIQARSVDFSNHLYGAFPKALIFMLIATYLLLLLMFRSLLLPL